MRMLVPVGAKIEEHAYGKGYGYFNFDIRYPKKVIGFQTVSGILRAGRCRFHSWSSED